MSCYCNCNCDGRAQRQIRDELYSISDKLDQLTVLVDEIRKLRALAEGTHPVAGNAQLVSQNTTEKADHDDGAVVSAQTTAQEAIYPIDERIQAEEQQVIYPIDRRIKAEQQARAKARKEEEESRLSIMMTIALIVVFIIIFAAMGSIH